MSSTEETALPMIPTENPTGTVVRSYKPYPWTYHYLNQQGRMNIVLVGDDAEEIIVIVYPGDGSPQRRLTANQPADFAMSKSGFFAVAQTPIKSSWSVDYDFQ